MTAICSQHDYTVISNSFQQSINQYDGIHTFTEKQRESKMFSQLFVCFFFLKTTKSQLHVDVMITVLII